MATKKRNPADATVSVQAKRNQKQDARIKALEKQVRAYGRALARHESYLILATSPAFRHVLARVAKLEKRA